MASRRPWPPCLAKEAAGLGIFDLDLRADVALWQNERMYELFARPPELGPLTLGEMEAEVVHPHDRAAFAAEIEAAAARGAPLHAPFRIRVPGGSRTLELFGRVLRDQEGAATRVIGTIADITDAAQSRRRGEKLIHELRHRVKNVLATNHAIARSSFPEGIDAAEGLQNLSARLMAQTQPQTGTSPPAQGQTGAPVGSQAAINYIGQQGPEQMLASNVIGATVRGSGNENIGEINDVLFDR